MACGGPLGRLRGYMKGEKVPRQSGGRLVAMGEAKAHMRVGVDRGWNSVFQEKQGCGVT